MTDINFEIPGDTDNFDHWCEWEDNSIRLTQLMVLKYGEYSSSDLQQENERVTLILKSMEVELGIDYIRNMWEVRFSSDELYGIFILKF